MVDTDLGTGGVQVSLNTEAGIQRARDERYPQDSDEKFNAWGGVRFNSADFEWYDFVHFSDETKASIAEIESAFAEDQSDKQFLKLYRQYEDSLVAVVNSLESPLTELHQTPYFFACVSDYNSSPELLVPLMRRTVPDVLFDRVFPQFGAFDRLSDRISIMPKDEQARYWLSAMVDLELEIASTEAAELKEMKVTSWDLCQVVARIGKDAIPQVFELAETYWSAEQLRSKSDVDSNKRSGFTPEADLYFSALRVLELIGCKDRVVRKRLLFLLQSLHTLAGPGDSKIGMNLISTAHTLHELSPWRFPKPDVGGSNNRLLNARKFGLK